MVCRFAKMVSEKCDVVKWQVGKMTSVNFMSVKRAGLYMHKKTYFQILKFYYGQNSL
uniref:Uncharacterized protein n=1 Tax=Rhizophagus irregularis (strain DAOM 181602 / DAOM 197198 / MUCL 43194) TaxID=747089 RepID=U9TR65_RHIID